MIEVIGSQDSSEGTAARRVVAAIQKQWPGIAAGEEESLQVAIGAKIFGYEVQDIDVVVCLSAQERAFSPLRPIACRPSGAKVTGAILVSSVVLAIEVKDHDHRGVRFEGNNVLVKYRDRWHDASQQSVAQAHALRQYLEATTGQRVFVTNLLYFPNLEEADLPPRPHNVIAGDLSGRALLSVIAEVARPYISSAGPLVSAGKDQAVRLVRGSRLFQSMTPGPLDRLKMERVSRRLGMDEKWLTDLGQKELLLRGRAGTGKTVALLQIAHKLFEDRGARSLLLTYNLALLADIRRITVLLNIPANGEHGGIRCDSAMAFISTVMSTLGLLDRSVPLLEQYDDAAELLAESISCGAIRPEEIQATLGNKNSDRFGFDFVMVDEAQDWPVNEIAIIRACFPSNHLIVADGLDQLIRGDRAAWTAGVPVANQKIWALGSALRLKANLAQFANELARDLGVEGWHVEPRAEVSGGRVLIVKGSISRLLRDQVTKQAVEDKNRLVDILLCVPPGLAELDSTSGLSAVATMLLADGVTCWDGTRRDIRLDIPRSLDEPRIVQYESCRGLEGWSVFCLGLSEFVDYKRKVSDPQVERWLMMAFTRAIDTIVVEIHPDDAFLTPLLERLATKMPDFVEVIEAC